jgi:hypothetical protein
MNATRAAPSPGLKITPPYGYDAIVPLERGHRVLLPRGATPQFCRSLDAIALTVGEFVAGGRDYPIAFVTTDGGATYAPVAILGLAARQNLFVSGSGEWDAAAYVPAFARRYPFCISKLYVDGEARSDKVVCVAKDYVDPGGIALFDDAGNPSAQWRDIERLLAEYEDDLDRTAEFCAALARLELFAPFTFQAMAADRVTLKVDGMYRVDASRFQSLRPASHKALVAKGFAGHVYAHFHSLENFARLYRRAVQRATAPR